MGVPWCGRAQNFSIPVGNPIEAARRVAETIWKLGTGDADPRLHAAAGATIAALTDGRWFWFDFEYDQRGWAIRFSSGGCPEPQESVP